MSSRLPVDLSVLEKETRAVQLKTEGYSYDDIAVAVGYSNRSAAHKAVVRALNRRPAESVDQMREVEGLRLEGMNQTLAEIINSEAASFDEKIKAINAAVRVSESIAKLFGLYAPIKTETSNTGTIEVVFSAALAPQRHGMQAATLEIDEPDLL
ncbi:hypothetical protein AL755_20130 [Arthrobacter sp. ERGS1:01]|uniref:hypothetical protein n=1 Tax=Arthrobacter sp. ERGS1:01 TaxID=1704044 RepID=UPI0006B5EDAD|nr:hypothetical protein [Arthrobacter sp. ERGS1:01]ALE07249.1 hypothetical protein AL755_20130 [Arthrobacter sp. ERGS1:01]